MPFLDRYWWLRLPRAVVVASAALAVAAFVTLDLSGPVGDQLPVLGWVGIISLALIGFAIALFIKMRNARNRARSRRAAIAGYQDAIPLAHGAAAIRDAMLPVLPFTMAFPLTRWDQPALARLRVCLSLPLLSLPLFEFALALLLAFRLKEALGIPLVVWIALAVVIVSFSRSWTGRGSFSRAIVKTYRTPRGIITDSLGIRWQPIVGRERAIRWDEVRLLEVASFDPTLLSTHEHAERRRYTLYTTTSAIWWIDPRNRHVSPSGPYAQLLALIKARTGLEAHTFESELFIPVVHEVIAAPSGATPAWEGDATYLLAFPLPSRRGRLIAGFFGILLTLLALLASIWTLSRFGLLTLSQVLQEGTSWLHAIPAFFLIMGGIIGLPLLIGAIRATPSQRLSRMGGIHADRTGLSTYPAHNGSIRAIAWSDVDSVQSAAIGPANAYMVRSATADTIIVWANKPRERTAPAELVTALGFTPISSDELVALVMRMTGKPLTSRDPHVATSGATHAVS